MQSSLSHALHCGRLAGTMHRLNARCSDELSWGEMQKAYKSLERSDSPDAVNLSLDALKQLDQEGRPLSGKELREFFGTLDSRFNQ